MGKQKSSESKSGSAQTWAQPYAASAVNQVQGVVNQNQPALQQLTDMTHQSVVNPLVDKFSASLGPAAQAGNYYSDVLNRKYLNGNPYMQQTLNALNGQVTDNANSHYNLSGRYGSDAHGLGVGQAIANADAPLLYQNYSDEMNRMGQAAQGAQAGNAADTASLISAIGANAQLPYTGTSNLANSLGALFNGGTSVQYSPNPIWGAIGAGLGAAGQILAPHPSDRRLKTKITKVGEFDDGLGIYTFAYKSDPNQMFKGVMADEVKELRPHAYIENFTRDGYDGVNYAAL